MPEDILITGVNGFLGGHMAKVAHQHGWRVWGLDRSGTPPDFVHSYLQTTLPSAASDLFIQEAKPSFCVHFAGMASVGLSVEKPDLDFASGPPVVFALLNQLRLSSPKCRVAFASSAAVYGNPVSLPVTEKQPPCPISPYGYHKLQSELILQEYAKLYHLPTVSFRLFSAYGEGLKKQVLWDMCQQLLTSGTLHLRGTGNETRDFIHGHDAARGILMALLGADMDGGAYNLASGQETSILQLATLVADALGNSVIPQFDGFVPPGDPLHWRADVSALNRWGFTCLHDLPTGVFNYANWCQIIHTPSR